MWNSMDTSLFTDSTSGHRATRRRARNDVS